MISNTLASGPSSDLIPVTPFARLFKQPPEKLFPEKIPSGAPDKEAESTTLEKESILCRQCRYIIARPDDMISINGAHQHTFANPGGVVYEISCFSSAPGCGYGGAPTDEFTWFPGYFWQVAICRRCLVHLGWYFSTKSGAGFHGLILDHLIFPKQ